jgi:hypothetical protein
MRSRHVAPAAVHRTGGVYGTDDQMRTATVEHTPTVLHVPASTTVSGGGSGTDGSALASGLAAADRPAVAAPAGLADASGTGAGDDVEAGTGEIGTGPVGETGVRPPAGGEVTGAAAPHDSTSVAAIAAVTSRRVSPERSIGRARLHGGRRSARPARR